MHPPTWTAIAPTNPGGVVQALISRLTPRGVVAFVMTGALLAPSPWATAAVEDAVDSEIVSRQSHTLGPQSVTRHSLSTRSVESVTDTAYARIGEITFTSTPRLVAVSGDDTLIVVGADDSVTYLPPRTSSGSFTFISTGSQTLINTTGIAARGNGLAIVGSITTGGSRQVNINVAPPWFLNSQNTSPPLRWGAPSLGPGASGLITCPEVTPLSDGRIDITTCVSPIMGPNIGFAGSGGGLTDDDTYFVVAEGDDTLAWFNLDDTNTIATTTMLPSCADGLSGRPITVRTANSPAPLVFLGAAATAACGAGEGRVQVIDGRDGTARGTIETGNDFPTAMSIGLLPRGDDILSVGSAGSVRIYSIDASGAATLALNATTSAPVTGTAVSSAGVVYAAIDDSVPNPSAGRAVLVYDQIGVIGTNRLGVAGGTFTMPVISTSGATWDDTTIAGITIGANPADWTRSGNLVTITAPAGSGTADITITLNGGNALDAGDFTYLTNLCPAPAGSYASGDGTAGNPYLISTPAHLQRLRDDSVNWDDSFILTADINMGSCTWTQTIGHRATPFTGGLDGDGHVITGLTITISADDSAGGVDAGFIGHLGAGGSLRDLGFTGDVSAAITETAAVELHVGGLVGYNDATSQILGSYATGDVVALAASGYPDDGPSPYRATTRVRAGALIGATAGTVENTYAVGSVQIIEVSWAPWYRIGDADVDGLFSGLVGLQTGGTITNSYNPGVNGLSASGEVRSGDSGSLSVVGEPILASVAAGTQSGLIYNAPEFPPGRPYATGYTAEQLRTPAPFGPAGRNWSFTEGYSATTVWSQCALHNNGLPFLSAFSNASVCLPMPVPPGPGPVPAVPPGAPRDLLATAEDASAEVTWIAPASTGSFPITTYQVTNDIDDSTCLLTVGPDNPLACEVTGLTNGTAYRFRARALTGAGWGPWSEWTAAVIPRKPGIVITGTRDGQRVRATGATTGIQVTQVKTRVRLQDQKDYQTGVPRPVDSDGTFTWQRTTSKKVYVYFTADGIRSNRIIIPARR